MKEFRRITGSIMMGCDRLLLPICSLLLVVDLVLCGLCPYIPKTECRTATRSCHCTRISNSDTVVCCNVTSESLKGDLRCAGLSSLPVRTRRLQIHGARFRMFPANLSQWSQLEGLSLTGGNIETLVGTFPGGGRMSCLNLSNNHLAELGPRVFTNLRNLQLLDLSGNNITEILESHLPPVGSHLALDISNNSHLSCNNLLDLIKTNETESVQFINRNSTECSIYRSFSWFNATDTMSLSHLVSMTQRLDLCPRGANYRCNCSIYRWDYKNLGNKLSVNCSGQHLTELPQQLPPNTISLDVSNNNITSLEPLRNKTSYSEIREFLADNNMIDSINVLETSPFIEQFAALSLKNNRITSIPTYFLSNVFDRNLYKRIVRFGGNRLHCDCNALLIKMWLLNNKNYIVDYREVLCDQQFDKVINIDPSLVCTIEKDWTDYIYYIIGGEVICLVLLVSKVTYDYWVFKSFGYLPWPASKMPKLPCDWCFET